MVVKHSRRFRRRGGAVVEFAVSFSLMFFFFAGTFQFGYGFYAYNKLETAVRGAARYASLIPYDSGSTTPSAAYATAVKNHAVYGDPAGGTIPVVPGLTPAHVKLQITETHHVLPATVSVSIDNFGIDSVFSTWTLRGKPYAAFRYQGRISGP